MNIGIRQILQQCNQDGHGQSESGGNVQILERMARGSKEQMITLAEGGMMKLKQMCINQADGKKAEENCIYFRRAFGGAD